MLVEHSGQEILRVISPYGALFLELCHVLLNELESRVDVVLRVLQEAKEQLHCTVSGASAHLGIGSVQPVNSITDSLNGVCERKLLVVVGMDTQLLAVLRCELAVQCCDTSNLLREQRTEAVNDVNYINRRLAQKIQSHLDISFLTIGDSHDVAGNLVAL